MNQETVEKLLGLCADDGDKTFHNADSTHQRSWKCDRCGQSYHARIKTMLRALDKTGYACPVCADLIVSPGYNDLATRYPNIADRLVPGLDASNTLYTRRTELDFTCRKGHVFHSTIQKMLEDDSCPICRSGGYVSESDLIDEWDDTANRLDPKAPDSPDNTLIGSNKKVHWKCMKCGNKWMTQVYNRGVRHQGCPQCAKRALSSSKRLRNAQKNPLSAHRNAADAWDYDLNDDRPNEISAGSPDKRWFKCERGHRFLLEVRYVAKNGFHCKQCAIADPVSDHADLLSYLDDGSIDPTLTECGSYHKQIHWLCPVCGYRFIATVPAMLSRMRDRGTMCPVCGMYELVPGVNDLATTRPDLASELADPSKASTVTEMSDTKLEWLCMDVSSHGSYVTTPRQRVAGVGCKICSALKRSAERNKRRLQDEDSDPVPQWIMDYAVPEDRKRIVDRGMSAGSSQTVTVFYPDCGHERRTTICNMVRSPECPICAYGLHMSSGQDEMTSWLKGLLGDDAVESNRSGILEGKRELDIWIPSKRIAVEYNGLYWHNEEHCGTTSAFDKWSECRKKGIRLLTVWDDDWQQRRSLVKRVTGSIIVGAGDNDGNPASYVRTEGSIAGMFMGRNSLSPWKIGKFSIAAADDEHKYLAMITGCMNDEELFVVNGYADVVGDGRYLAGLLHEIYSELSPGKIVVKLDHCLYGGDELNGLGFQPVSESPPGFFLTKGGIERIHGCEHSGAHSKLSENHEIYDDGVCRVYDAGYTNLVLSNPCA